MKSNAENHSGGPGRGEIPTQEHGLAPAPNQTGPLNANEDSPPSPHPCVHYVGFRDDRYWNARRIWGGPAFIHRWWDKRARRDIADCDTVIFAEGEWTQEPHRHNAPDITEDAA